MYSYLLVSIMLIAAANGQVGCYSGFNAAFRELFEAGGTANTFDDVATFAECDGSGTDDITTRPAFGTCATELGLGQCYGRLIAFENAVAPAVATVPDTVVQVTPIGFSSATKQVQWFPLFQDYCMHHTRSNRATVANNPTTLANTMRLDTFLGCDDTVSDNSFRVRMNQNTAETQNGNLDQDETADFVQMLAPFNSLRLEVYCTGGVPDAAATGCNKAPLAQFSRGFVETSVLADKPFTTGLQMDLNNPLDDFLPDTIKRRGISVTSIGDATGQVFLDFAMNLLDVCTADLHEVNRNGQGTTDYLILNTPANAKYTITHPNSESFLVDADAGLIGNTQQVTGAFGGLTMSYDQVAPRTLRWTMRYLANNFRGGPDAGNSNAGAPEGAENEYSDFRFDVWFSDERATAGNAAAVQPDHMHIPDGLTQVATGVDADGATWTLFEGTVDVVYPGPGEYVTFWGQPQRGEPDFDLATLPDIDAGLQQYPVFTRFPRQSNVLPGDTAQGRVVSARVLDAYTGVQHLDDRYDFRTESLHHMARFNLPPLVSLAVGENWDLTESFQTATLDTVEETAVECDADFSTRTMLHLERHNAGAQCNERESCINVIDQAPGADRLPSLQASGALGLADFDVEVFPVGGQCRLRWNLQGVTTLPASMTAANFGCAVPRYTLPVTTTSGGATATTELQLQLTPPSDVVGRTPSVDWIGDDWYKEINLFDEDTQTETFQITLPGLQVGDQVRVEVMSSWATGQLTVAPADVFGGLVDKVHTITAADLAVQGLLGTVTLDLDGAPPAFSITGTTQTVQVCAQSLVNLARACALLVVNVTPEITHETIAAEIVRQQTLNKNALIEAAHKIFWRSLAAKNLGAALAFHALGADKTSPNTAKRSASQELADNVHDAALAARAARDTAALQSDPQAAVALLGLAERLESEDLAALQAQGIPSTWDKLSRKRIAVLGTAGAQVGPQVQLDPDLGTQGAAIQFFGAQFFETRKGIQDLGAQFVKGVQESQTGVQGIQEALIAEGIQAFIWNQLQGLQAEQGSQHDRLIKGIQDSINGTQQFLEAEQGAQFAAIQGRFNALQGPMQGIQLGANKSLESLFAVQGVQKQLDLVGQISANLGTQIQAAGIAFNETDGPEIINDTTAGATALGQAALKALSNLAEQTRSFHYQLKSFTDRIAALAHINFIKINRNREEIQEIKGSHVEGKKIEREAAQDDDSSDDDSSD